MHVKQKRKEKWKPTEIGAIIISPTRELAVQINEVLQKFLNNMPHLKQVLLVGGTTIAEDADKLKTAVNIIVATPGRLEDILSNCKSINLAARVKSLVIYSKIVNILFMMFKTFIWYFKVLIITF